MADLLLRLATISVAILLLAPLQSAFAQEGVISGSVVDAQTGETLIGVNILIGGTLTGTTTDLDGHYRLRTAPGTYSVIYSYIGFDTQTVENVRVVSGEEVTLDIPLSPTSMGLGEIVVQAEAVLNNESGLLRLQARSPQIMDGLSAQQIRRSPDSNSGEALRRVTGVTVSGGKFVFVRGIPERYNGTMLNGSPVASTEPDRRAFAYDLIPANLLDNVMVAKTASPDLPGDFSGGLLQLNTIDFPDSFTATLSLSSGINNATGATILSGPRGTRDFLGMDDGTRALPSVFPQGNIGSGSSLTDADRSALGRTLPNGWAIGERRGPVAPNLSFGVGGSTRGRWGQIGAVGAVTYRSSYDVADLIRRDFEGEDQLRFDYSGLRHGYNVTWGGIANVSYRPSPLHSVSFKNFYSRTADDEVALLSGFQFTDQGAEQRRTTMRFLARDVYSGQFIGEHAFQSLLPGGLRVRWDVGRSLTTRDEPDYRSMIYQRRQSDVEVNPDAPFTALVGSTIGANTGGRFFSAMDEGTWSGSLRGSLTVSGARLTAGGFAQTTDRTFESRFLAATLPSSLQLRQNFDGSLLLLPLSEIFRSQNFGRLDREGCENGGRGCQGFILNESAGGGSDYDAGQDVTAAFAMVDAPLTFVTRRLRLHVGVRYERATQRLQGVDGQSGDSLNVRTPYRDLLPSVNLTYALTEQANLRLAYSRNLNRPELRELAPFQYYDFELQTLTYGNPALRQAQIQNVDFRAEVYPGPGQLFSVSLFYKHFDSPIERAIVSGVARNAERQFINATSATSYGFELEGRYGLGFLTPYLNTSSVLFNFTWVESEVTAETDGATLFRTGRPLQGQSPYVVNLGLHFEAPRTRTQVTLLYNRLGSRVTEVATGFEEDIREAPRDLLDFSLTQPLLGRYELRLHARDLLNQPQRFVQEGEVVRENRRGRSIGFGLSARF